MKTKREFIKEIIPNKANFDYCTEKGIINGSLLADIERIMQKYADQQLAIYGLSKRLFYFDCWKRDGILDCKEIEATCEEHATLKFEKEFGEDYGFDPPYC